MPLISPDNPIIITVSQLPTALQSTELVDMMIAGANAKAARVAPCLKATPTSDQLDEARLVLIGAIRRWAEAGSGALQSQQAGPFGMTVDTRQRTGYNLWPSEIEALQDICKAAGEGGQEAFSISPSDVSSIHAPWCALNLGATYCSCGADIAGFPIYEQP